MNAFEALGLNEKLVQAITDLGFTEPTPIQEKAIPVLLSGTTDFVGLANRYGENCSLWFTIDTTDQPCRQISAGADRLSNQGTLFTNNQRSAAI